MSIPVSVQLYTLREYTAIDIKGVLQKISEIGYAGVEFAGYEDKPASQIKTWLDDLNLKASGSHVNIDILKNKLDWVIDYNLEIGSNYIICPWAKLESIDDYIELAELCNNVGEKCNSKGIQFCYHNHAHEFNKFDGEFGLDILYKQTKSELVMAEIDTYWVKRAGLNPADYIKKYTGRCPLIHFKDMEDGPDMSFAEVGTGTMDFSEIAEVSASCGAKWFVVEQDKCKRDPLESITISFLNLKKLNLV